MYISVLATNRDLYDWGWAWPLLTIVFPKWTWHKNWHLLPKLWETSYFFFEICLHIPIPLWFAGFDLFSYFQKWTWHFLAKLWENFVLFLKYVHIFHSKLRSKFSDSIRHFYFNICATKFTEDTENTIKNAQLNL